MIYHRETIQIITSKLYMLLLSGMDPFPRLIPVMKANGKILPHDCSLQGLEKVWLVETLECQIL